MNEIIKKIEAEQLKENAPEFHVGDTVKVYAKIKEGNRERIQVFAEVTLRDLPRITVRGQTVQGGSVPLRKAPLPSSVYPWSTKRPCGPLAFRRATEGSRVQRKGWGVKRGRETLVSLPLLPPPPGGGTPLRRGYGVPLSAGRPRQSCTKL